MSISHGQRCGGAATTNKTTGSPVRRSQLNPTESSCVGEHTISPLLRHIKQGRGWVSLDRDPSHVQLTTNDIFRSTNALTNIFPHIPHIRSCRAPPSNTPRVCRLPECWRLPMQQCPLQRNQGLVPLFHQRRHNTTRVTYQAHGRISKGGNRGEGFTRGQGEEFRQDANDQSAGDCQCR